MPKTKTINEFQVLQNRVKFILARAIQLKKMQEDQLLACLYILSQAKSQYELESFINIFEDAFPVLKEITEGQAETAREDLETKVKNALGKIVKKAPLKATEIAKAAIEPGMTWDKLTARYPELK